jgi:hypothetical protein
MPLLIQAIILAGKAQQQELLAEKNNCSLTLPMLRAMQLRTLSQC